MARIWDPIFSHGSKFLLSHLTCCNRWDPTCSHVSKFLLSHLTLEKDEIQYFLMEANSYYRTCLVATDEIQYLLMETSFVIALDLLKKMRSNIFSWKPFLLSHLTCWKGWDPIFCHWSKFLLSHLTCWNRWWIGWLTAATFWGPFRLFWSIGGGPQRYAGGYHGDLVIW